MEINNKNKNLMSGDFCLKFVILFHRNTSTYLNFMLTKSIKLKMFSKKKEINC